MKAYLVEGGGLRRYAGSQTEVREKRDEIMELAGIKKKDVTHEEVEIPTNKAELIPFINEIVIELETNTAEAATE